MSEFAHESAPESAPAPTPVATSEPAAAPTSLPLSPVSYDIVASMKAASTTWRVVMIIEQLLVEMLKGGIARMQGNRNGFVMMDATFRDGILRICSSRAIFTQEVMFMFHSRNPGLTAWHTESGLEMGIVAYMSEEMIAASAAASAPAPAPSAASASTARVYAEEEPVYTDSSASTTKPKNPTDY